MKNLVITNTDLLIWLALDIFYIIIVIYLMVKTPKYERSKGIPYLFFAPFGFIPLVIIAVLFLIYGFCKLIRLE